MKDNSILGYRKNGTPIRVIRGGAPDAPAAETKTEAPPAPAGTPAPGADAEDEAKRAGGVEALKADLAGERDKRQKIETEFSEFKTQFVQAMAALTGQKPSDSAPTPESLAEQLAALQGQLTQKDEAAQARVVKAEVRSAALNLQFHDPTDAIARLDLSKVPVTDGEVDTAFIETELKAIAEKSPYLVKQPGAAAAADVGLGGTGDSKGTPKSGRDRIAAGLEANGKK